MNIAHPFFPQQLVLFLQLRIYTGAHLVNATDQEELQLLLAKKKEVSRMSRIICPAHKGLETRFYKLCPLTFKIV